MVSYSIYNTYLLVHFVSSNQVMLFDTYQRGYPFEYYYTVTQQLVSTNSLSIATGLVVSGSYKTYVGGNNAWQVVSMSANGGPITDQVGFIYSA